MSSDTSLSSTLQNIASGVCSKLLAIENEPIDDASFHQQVTEILESGIDELVQTNLVGRENQLPSSEVWKVAKSVLQRGSLQTHAREKPGGYAGDFRLLDRICREEVRGERGGVSGGGDRLGSAMDRFFQEQAAPIAVRNRYRKLADEIVTTTKQVASDSAVRLMSFGSGPGWELNWAVDRMNQVESNASERLRPTLIDIDPNALEFCQEHLSSRLTANQLKTVRLNLARFPRLRSVRESLGSFDLIYCAGFFDYLDDSDAVDMLQTLWSHVGLGGKLVVFNFAEANPSRPYMEWIGNWYLTYRTADSFLSLAKMAKLDGCEFAVDVEPAGVNLFLTCRRG